MTIEPFDTLQAGFMPDQALAPFSADASANSTPLNGGTSSAADFFGGLLSASSQALTRAQNAEQQVVAGQGSLLEMSVERARADSLLGLMNATASRVASAFSSFSSMAV